MSADSITKEEINIGQGGVGEGGVSECRGGWAGMGWPQTSSGQVFQEM